MPQKYIGNSLIVRILYIKLFIFVEIARHSLGTRKSRIHERSECDGGISVCEQITQI